MKRRSTCASILNLAYERGSIKVAPQLQKRPNVYTKEFTRVLAEAADIPEDTAEHLTEVFLKTITATLAEKHSICFPDFGIFELHETTERVGRNPKTMEECVIPASVKPVFRPAKNLRDTMNKVVQEEPNEAVEIA